MKRKSRRRLVIGAVLVIAAALVFWMMSGARQSAQRMHTEEVVKTQDLSTYLSFSGHVRSAHSKQQIAQESLKVRQLYVEEGDRVEQGQPLLRSTDGQRVYAAIGGTVEVLYAEQDGLLSPGSPIADLVDYEQLLVKVDADEYDVGALSVGQQVSVYINALEREIDGAIEKIANDAAVGKNVSYYTVDIVLGETGPLRAGMSVEARMLDRQAAGATTISMKALQFDAENRPFVYLRDAGGGLYAQSVEVGISDGATVQILSGVQPGQTVYRPADAVVMPGMMMRGRP